MEVLGRQPCKSEQELGWESFHPSSAHHLFDEMSSPLEMFEEDVLLVMREEKITWDEAVHLLQEELRDAQRRMNDKLDRLMEMLDSTETTRSKTSSAHLNGSKTTETTNVILKAASQPPQASPSSAPTKCSTVGLDIKGGVDHAGVTCQTMTGVSRDVPASIQAVADFAPRPIANIKQNQLMPTRCSMKFLGHDNKVSMYTNTQELELGKWELRSAPWVAFGCCWPRVHRLPPWPPPTEVSCLALLCHGTGMISIELMDVDLRWGELKPWPPPNNSDSKHTMVQLEHCWFWEIGVTINQSAWKKQWDLVNQRSCTFNEICGMHYLGVGHHYLLQVKLLKLKVDKQIIAVLLVRLLVPVERLFHGCFVIFTKEFWICLQIIQPVDRRVLMQLLVVGDSLYLTEMNCIAPGNWLSDKVLDMDLSAQLLHLLLYKQLRQYSWLSERIDATNLEQSVGEMGKLVSTELSYQGEVAKALMPGRSCCFEMRFGAPPVFLTNEIKWSCECKTFNSPKQARIAVSQNGVSWENKM